MTVSRLLKSCATPPASWPIASILCAWRRRSSLARSSDITRSRWIATPASCAATWSTSADPGSGAPATLRYSAKVPSSSPVALAAPVASPARIGIEKQEHRPWGSATSRNAAHSGSVAMSVTSTGSRRYAAVPQEPTDGPMGTPSTAALYAAGRLGPAPERSTSRPGSRTITAQSDPGSCSSTIATTPSSTPVRSSPVAIRASTRFWATSMASASFRRVMSTCATTAPPVAGPSGVTRMENQRRSAGLWQGYSSSNRPRAPDSTDTIPAAASSAWLERHTSR